MQKLTPFWQLIETLAGRTAVMRQWQDNLGDALPVVRPLLQPIDRKVCSYPDPRPHGHWLKVVRHRNGSIVAVAEDDWQFRIELSPKDIVLYRMDIRGLRRLLARVLSLQFCEDACDPDAITIRLGDWEAGPGQVYPVVLTMATDRRRFLSEVQRLLLASASKVILLTPAKRHWTGEVTDLLASKAALASLDDILLVDEGNWQATGKWASCLASFRQMAIPETLVPAPPPFEFRKDGRGWILRYGGVMKPFGELKGLWYIRYLLMHQGEEAFVIRMLADITGDKRFLAASDAGEVMGESEKQDCGRKLAELEEELQKAIKSGNAMIEKEIETEKEALVAAVLSAHGFGGRGRKLSDDYNRAYKSLHKCITEVFRILEHDHPSLGVHLRAFVNTGITMSYKPDTWIDWST